MTLKVFQEPSIKFMNITSCLELSNRLAIAYLVDMSCKCICKCLLTLTRHFGTRHQTFSNQTLDTYKKTLDTFRQTLDTSKQTLDTFRQTLDNFNQTRDTFPKLKNSTRHLLDIYQYSAIFPNISVKKSKIRFFFWVPSKIYPILSALT